MRNIIIVFVILINFSFLLAQNNAPEVTNDSNFEKGTVTDIDGNVYQTIEIGAQWWMAENLKVTHYLNGDDIPNVTNNGIWGGLSIGACCAYNNDTGNVSTYGLLYNWYAVGDSRNIAPEGWHVPTDEEWKELEMYLGMSQVQADSSFEWRGTDEGGKLKATGTIEGGDGLWFAPNTGATNQSGFTVLPGGFRNYAGAFNVIGKLSHIWSSTYDSLWYWGRALRNISSAVYRGGIGGKSGFSVRLIQDIAIGIEDENTTPVEYFLNQNYPNPFNPSTKIRYSITQLGLVTLKLYDVLGIEIETLVNEEKLAGTYELNWNAANLPSGVYFYQLQAGDFVQTRKMILLK